MRETIFGDICLELMTKHGQRLDSLIPVGQTHSVVSGQLHHRSRSSAAMSSLNLGRQMSRMVLPYEAWLQPHADGRT